jgi:hypothetical protein
MIQKTKKNLASSKWAIEIIFSLYMGQDEKIPNAHFLLICQEKKREKTIKTKFVFEGQSNGGFNLQHTTTMHKWGQVQKREKSFYWHTSWQLQKPNCMSSLPPFTPLNSGCL